MASPNVFIPELKTHCQKVCRLYKEAMRLVEAYYHARAPIRYHQVLLRARFDENKKLDLKRGQHLLYVGQDEVFKLKHPVPMMRFAQSQPGIAGGVAWERVVTPPDWVMDYWHPLEKAQYPKYFARREKRKQEFIQRWYAGQIV